MDKRQAREMGQALAFLNGDRRDWPPQCAWPDCHSEDIFMNHVHFRWACNTCHRYSSPHVVREEIERRAREAVMGGVGGPLVEVMEQERKRN